MLRNNIILQISLICGAYKRARTNVITWWNRNLILTTIQQWVMLLAVPPDNWAARPRIAVTSMSSAVTMIFMRWLCWLMLLIGSVEKNNSKIVNIVRALDIYLLAYVNFQCLVTVSAINKERFGEHVHIYLQKNQSEPQFVHCSVSQDKNSRVQ